MKAISFGLALALTASAPAAAEVTVETVVYKQGGAGLEGLFAYDKAQAGKRPAVLIIHDWMGVGDYVKKRAEMLAKEGYAAFTADIYGKGVRPKNNDEASAQAGKFRGDRKLLRARAQAGLSWLKAHEKVDANKVVAIGYCFGGGAALELARAGADLKGVISFHGNLDTPNPADAKQIKAKVLVLHGADDPFVKPEQVAAFEQEMRDAKVDWQLIKYGNAVHSFTHWHAGTDNAQGAAYNEKADKRSWQAMLDFFREVL